MAERDTPETKEPRAPTTPREAVQALVGKSPDADAVAALDWYQEIRDALRLARNDAGLSQQQLARRLGVRQSEVSRFENALGFGTGLGKLRDFLVGCGAQLSLAIETAAGRTLLSEPQLDRPWPAAAGLPWEPVRVSVDDIAFAEPDLALLGEALPALEQAMMDAGLQPAQALTLRHRFLQRYKAMRQMRSTLPDFTDPSEGSASANQPGA